jgi:hypothetical protein
MRNSMTVFFNHPDHIDPNTTTDVFGHCVSLITTQTLAEAKAAMLASLVATAAAESPTPTEEDAAHAQTTPTATPESSPSATPAPALAPEPEPAPEVGSIILPLELELLHLRRLGAKGADGVVGDGIMFKVRSRVLADIYTRGCHWFPHLCSA